MTSADCSKCRCCRTLCQRLLLVEGDVWPQKRCKCSMKMATERKPHDDAKRIETKEKKNLSDEGVTRRRDLRATNQLDGDPPYEG